MKKSPPAISRENKWLDWPDFLKIVQTLRDDCSIYNPDGSKRDPKTVAQKFQAYLIFGILACIPDRQRTLRELQVGKTLIRTETDDQVKWEIVHGADDYKTGSTYGARPRMKLNPNLNGHLDEYCKNWRHHFKPNHNYLFSARNGKALTTASFSELFVNTIERLSGKKTNPHLIRDMIVTHLRNQPDTSDRELEALAMFMGHSVETQKGSYDKRTLQQKINPAVSLIEKMNRKYV